MALLTHCAARYDGRQLAACVLAVPRVCQSAKRHPHAVPTGALKETESCAVFINIAACQRTNGVPLQYLSDTANVFFSNPLSFHLSAGLSLVKHLC